MRRRSVSASSCEAQVAAERQVHTRAHSGAVHGRQSGQRAAGDTQESLVNTPETLLGGLGQVAERRALRGTRLDVVIFEELPSDTQDRRGGLAVFKGVEEGVRDHVLGGSAFLAADPILEHPLDPS